MMRRKIWIYAQQQDNRLTAATYQLITHVRTWQQELSVILFEQPQQHLEQQLAGYGVQNVLTYHYQQYLDDVQKATLLAQLVHQYQPDICLFSADDEGRAIAPHVQVLLNVGLTADCVDLKYQDGQLLQYKPSYGDDVICEIIDLQTPQMATVRPGMFIAQRLPNNDAMPNVSDIDTLLLPANHMHLVHEHPLHSQPVDVAQAQRIIAIGRGASDDESVALAKQLAAKLDAVVMTSRPASLLPGFGQAHQIGLTGNTVSPDWLLTLGISGSTQFLAGVKNVHTLVAVNTDAHANILNYADYQFIGDAKQFMQACLTQLG